MSDSANKFIIMFKDGVTQDQIDKYIAHINGGGGEVTHTYGTLIPGFAAKITPSQLELFKSLQSGEEDIIASIEEDSVVHTQ